MDPRIEAHQRAGEILKQIQDLEDQYADHMAALIGQSPVGNYRRPPDIQTTKKRRPKKDDNDPAGTTSVPAEVPELENYTLPTDDEFTVKVAPISDAQFGKIYATLADQGIKNEDQQDAIIKALLKKQQGIEVDSKTQIRKDHAIDLITELADMDREDMLELLPDELKEPF